MARFFPDPSILDRDQVFQHGDGTDTAPEPSLFETDDLASAFADSFLDFDSIKNWIEEFPDTSWDKSTKVERSGGLNGNTKPSNGSGFLANPGGGSCGESCVDGSEKLHNLAPPVGEGMRERGGFAANLEDGYCRESCIRGSIIDGSEKLRDLGPPVGEDTGKRERDSFSVILEDGYGGESCFDGLVMDGSKKLGNLGPSVEEGMGKGSVVAADGGLLGIDENEVKRENDNLLGGDDISNASVSVSESKSTSSSSELSTSSDDDSGCCGEEAWTEKKKKDNLEEEREEGEIIDSDAEEMYGWSGSDDHEDVGDGRHRFRSNIEVEDLPPVPLVNVTLQRHHQTQPVGIVLSIIGARVIVEGVENHNPLSEGSILWITDARSPLGLIDEVFGPVKNPYYAVRYNSDNEVPGGVHAGTSVSFVSDFANHVLNDDNLHNKGYDVSSENSEDDLEFSDDEKEAEYRRMMKMNKRGVNDERAGKRKNKRKKGKRRDECGTQNQVDHSASQTVVCKSQLPPKPDQNHQHQTPHMVAPQDHGNCSSFLGTGHTSGGVWGPFPPFAQPAESPGFSTVPSGFWTNGFQPCLQQPAPVLPDRSPGYGLVWPQQHYLSQQIPQQMSLPNMMPIQQHFNQHFAPVGFPRYGQMNSITGPTYRPCTHPSEQNVFNQTPHGMDLHGQNSIPSWPPMSTGGQGVLLNRPQTAHNSNQCPPSAVQDSAPVPQKFSSGAFPGRGNRPYRRGGGGFQGRRGQQQIR